MRGCQFWMVAGLLTGAILPAQIQLTSASGGGERQPVLSADGSVVAYAALVGGVREVFTVPALGGAPARRTNGANVRLGGTTVFDAWPSLAMSDDGSKVTYWNAAGVHVLDLGAGTDKVVATENLLPYPQIDGDGSRVVFQGLVGGTQEVFVVGTAGGAATQITTASGPGRRLPHIRGNRIVFQRSVSGFQEVFLHDLGTKTTIGPISSSSGSGNRYARLTHTGSQIVYEALAGAGTVKEVFLYDIAIAARRQMSTSSLRGDRMAQPTADGEAFYELSATNREVQRLDLTNSTLVPVTAATTAGYRRVSVDRHGTIAVYQAQAGDTTEVFVNVRCYAPTLGHYGQAGTPSVGVLLAADAVYRSTFVLGLDTGLPIATASLFVLGVRPVATPLPNAPGNFLYVDPLLALGTNLDAKGDVAIRIDSPLVLCGSSAFGQWVVNDPAANALGWVSSKGVRVDFR